MRSVRPIRSSRDSTPVTQRSDRRYHRRRRARVPVRLCAGERPYLGFTLDVSLGGARIKADVPCQPLERLVVQILARGGPVRLDAEVVRQSSDELGVRFLRLTSDSMQHLAAVVAGSAEDLL